MSYDWGLLGENSNKKCLVKLRMQDASFIHLFKKALLNSFHKVCTHQAGWVLRPTQHCPCLLGPFILTVIDESSSSSSSSSCKQILHTTNIGPWVSPKGKGRNIYLYTYHCYSFLDNDCHFGEYKQKQGCWPHTLGGAMWPAPPDGLWICDFYRSKLRRSNAQHSSCLFPCWDSQGGLMRRWQRCKSSLDG